MSARFAHRWPAANPYRDVKVAGGFDLAGKGAGEDWQVPADYEAGSLPFERLTPCRRGYNYRHRRNYEGRYLVAASGQFVYFESLVERSVAMQLDHEGDIVAIAAQPFAIIGPHYLHYVDFAALLRDGSRVVIDVRPASLIDARAAEQFSIARDVLAAMGVAYEVRHGPTGTAAQNLEWLAQYRHRTSSLDDERAATLVQHASSATDIGDLAAATLPSDAPRARAGIYHALWTRKLELVSPGLLTSRSRVIARQEATA